MTKHWLIGLIMGCLFLSLPAQAQTFEDGYQSYVRNQFPVAELQFKNALKKATADEEKSFILKFIGICQYMRGDKTNSGQSFQQALTLDRNVQIDADEVLDPGVVSFFDAIKSRMGPEVKKQPKAEPIVKAPAPKAPVVRQPVQAAAPKAKPKPKAKVVRKKNKGEDSILGLSSNVTTAEKSSSNVHYMQFLPFGLPQVHNKSYLFAGAFAAGQVTTLFLYMQNNDKLIERKKLNGVVARNELLTQKQRDDFYEANDAYIADIKAQKNLAIAGFAAIWAASVAESFINRPSSVKSAELDLPTPPQQSFRPIVQAGRKGGTFGLSWQTELK